MSCDDLGEERGHWNQLKVFIGSSAIVYALDENFTIFFGEDNPNISHSAPEIFRMSF